MRRHRIGGGGENPALIRGGDRSLLAVRLLAGVLGGTYGLSVLA
jgi:hypothetical protein